MFASQKVYIIISISVPLGTGFSGLILKACDSVSQTKGYYLEWGRTLKKNYQTENMWLWMSSLKKSSFVQFVSISPSKFSTESLRNVWIVTECKEKVQSGITAGERALDMPKSWRVGYVSQEHYSSHTSELTLTGYPENTTAHLGYTWGTSLSFEHIQGESLCTQTIRLAQLLEGIQSCFRRKCWLCLQTLLDYGVSPHRYGSSLLSGRCELKSSCGRNDFIIEQQPFHLLIWSLKHTEVTDLISNIESK